MRKFLIATCFLFFSNYAIGAITFGPQTPAQKIEFCQTCYDVTDASNFVLSEAYAGHLTGAHTIEISNINLNPIQTWFISYEYYPSDYPKPILDSASTGTSTDNIVASTLITAEVKPVVVVISPGSPDFGAYSFDTLRDWTPETLFPIVNAQWMFLNENATAVLQDSGDGKIIEEDILEFFGHGPIATVVFSDGTVGQFEFAPNDAKIEYVPGSGRYPNGALDSLYGNGSNGNQYVIQRSSENGFYLDPSPTEHLTCGTVTVTINGDSTTGYNCYEIP
jgi:hypothetical protein